MRVVLEGFLLVWAFITLFDVIGRIEAFSCCFRLLFLFRYLFVTLGGEIWVWFT